MGTFASLPRAPLVDPVSGLSALSSVEGVKRKLEEELTKQPEKSKAAYKIEVWFSRHRSSLSHKASPAMVLVWESGKRFHGGGDQKMFWCGYNDCQKPFSNESAQEYTVVCPHCLKEMVLSPGSRLRAIEEAEVLRRDSSKLNRIPEICGEKLVRLTPRNLSLLLAKTWTQLEANADIYVKYSPYELRYDPKHEDTSGVDKLFKARNSRLPLIYPLERILRDISGGAALENVILAMLVA